MRWGGIRARKTRVLVETLVVLVWSCYCFYVAVVAMLVNVSLSLWTFDETPTLRIQCRFRLYLLGGFATREQCESDDRMLLYHRVVVEKFKAERQTRPVARSGRKI